jgi:hypothetical protein
MENSLPCHGFPSHQIYQSIPSTCLDELYDLLGIFATAEPVDDAETELDWPLLLAKMDREGKGELSKWLRRQAQKEADLESVCLGGKH